MLHTLTMPGSIDLACDPSSPSTQVCDRMPKANMLRGMLSYLQGEGNLVTQAQANEVGGWEKCGDHCQCDPSTGRRGGWLGKLWGKCGEKAGMPQGCQLAVLPAGKGEAPL